MFESLTGRLGDIFDRLRKRGALSEEDVTAALREVRIALLEADVALPAVKSFIQGVKEKAVGAETLRGINPGHMVVKIVHDHLTALLGGANEGLNLNATPPAAILMLGLQGSGKTTTSAKLALRLKTREKKKLLLASLDTRRPAAQEQLQVLAGQIGATSLPIIPGQSPVEIARRAMEMGRLEGYDAVILDTAGRLAIDEALMAEAAAVCDATQPVERLLVVDAMTGQDAVNVATAFHERIGITGIIMTRVDGDARGGAALSMRHVTGQPIKFLGVGEKADALEPFHPERIAGRILGMGDVVSLVEKAAESIDREEAEKLARKMEKGGFDLNDMLAQMRQIDKLGGMGGMLNLLPGMGKIKDQLKDAKIDATLLKRQEAIILSMTLKERKKPDILNASRRRRIALGSGVTVADVNRLIKNYQDMADMMRKFKKLGQKGLLRQGLSALMPKGMR
jgi:signal recognition particle subunit SRP54